MLARFSFAVPFIIYAIGLVIAAAVTGVFLRSAGQTTAGNSTGEPVTVREALRHGAYRAADRIGRKPVTVVGLTLAAIGTIGFGLSDSVVVFIVATAVAGIGSGMLNPAQTAAVADIIGNKSSGGPALAGFQLTGVMFLLGIVVWAIAPETLVKRSSGRAKTPPGM